MIYMIAQPDELYFVWQCHTQLENFLDVNIDPRDVYYLVATTPGKPVHPQWTVLKEEYGCNVVFIEDTRSTKFYIPSVRPHVIAKFLRMNPSLANGGIVYIDCDVIFSKEPNWLGMQDGRWHITPDKDNYISHGYIKSKGSQKLVNDMLSVVGIDEETVQKGDANVGGIHYYIPNTTPDFWEIIERNTEQVYNTVQNLNQPQYKDEHFNNVYLKRDNAKQEDWEKYQTLSQSDGGYDFQIWCADLFCIYWQLLKNGTSVYANPAMSFSWPTQDESVFMNNLFMHNSGAVAANAHEVMLKQNYQQGREFEAPFLDTSIDHLGYRVDKDTAQRIKLCQWYYIQYIIKIRNKMQTKQELFFQSPDYIEANSFPSVSSVSLGYEPYNPLVSCVMTTYGRSELVERSIRCWLSQTYKNKELIIYNTAVDHPYTLSYELQDKGIRIINNNTDHVTHKPYDNVGAIRRDATVYAEGDLYICWDDDDFYLPWHINQGVRYLANNPSRKAYMPMKSYFTADGGSTISLEQNSMEASCIVDINSIRSYGFLNSNGAEHLSWRQGMLPTKELVEDYSVTPLESYIYIWGEEISPRKQSAFISDPDNFKKHKEANTDFSNGVLELADSSVLVDWYYRILNFVNSKQVLEALINIK